MLRHSHTDGKKPSRLLRERRLRGAGVAPVEGEGAVHGGHRTLIVSGSLLLAAAAGVTLFVSAVMAARQVPYSVRLYADRAAAEGEARLLRVTAYDARERTMVGIESATLIDGDRGAKIGVFSGSADGSAVVGVPAGRPPGGYSLALASGAGGRTVAVPAITPQPREAAAPALKPVSAELRTGGALQIGIGTGPQVEEYNTGTLDSLRIVLYPEQGRLAANLPNKIHLWARNCPSPKVLVGTAAGSGTIDVDGAGMASLGFTPSFGQTWFDVACGAWRGRVELRDRPQGVVASSGTPFSAGGAEVVMQVHTIAGSHPFTMDVFRDCAWIDSRAFVPVNGEAELRYTLPAEPGLYTFEFYGNTHAPGGERALVPVIVPGKSAAESLRGILGRVSGAGEEPLSSHVRAVLGEGDPPAGKLAGVAAAFLSRLDLSCGPPPLVMDSYDDDALFLRQKKAGVKRAAYTGVGVTWAVAMVAAILVMVLRIRAAAEAEERIAGHRRHIALQHTFAAALITIGFALLVYTLDVWWGK